MKIKGTINVESVWIKNWMKDNPESFEGKQRQRQINEGFIPNPICSLRFNKGKINLESVFIVLAAEICFCHIMKDNPGKLWRQAKAN